MQFIRDMLTYEEVKHRFEREFYTLLSSEYKNAKSNLNVLCSRGHEWTTNMSNFDSGRRCSICSRKKKYTLDEVQRIFAAEGNRVLDSIFINGKTPIKFACANGHETEVNLNNFMNGRRCTLCKRVNVPADRIKLKLKLNSKETVPRREVKGLEETDEGTINEPVRQVKPEWLEKLDDMRKNLKLGKRRTYRE